MRRGKVKEEDRAERERETEKVKKMRRGQMKEEDRAKRERETEESKEDVERASEEGR
jgi:hypothetical protein